MPNIVITTHCNRRCPYCFALDAMDGAGAGQMSLRELITIADMIVASGRPSASVLGGEPTLHPQFAEIVQYLLARGLRVRVFTNGICREGCMAELEPLPPRERLKFIVNVNFPEIETEPNRLHQEAFIRRFAANCDFSLNIHRTDLDPLFLVDLAKRTGVRNARIRVGMAQPIAGESNEFLGLAQYRRAAERIVRLAEAAFDLGLVVSLDCGFPLCSFSNEQLGRLRRTGADTKFICKTATDIAPGMTAWSCFPLAKRNRTTIDNQTSLADLERRFLAMNDEHRKRLRKGVFKECDTCSYLARKVCDGGCLAHVLSEDRTPAEVRS